MVKNTKNNKKVTKSWLQFLKYILCAVSAGIIQIISFSILTFCLPKEMGDIVFITRMPLSTFIATTTALALSILWNFTANRKFTFKDAGNIKIAMILAFLFYLPFYPLQTWWVHFGAELMPFEYKIATVVAEFSAMAMNFLLEFFWQKYVVFRKQQ